MNALRIPAVFARGGTSKAVIFKAADLPADQAARDRIFLHVMGSPDPYGRQLNGMGGGLSSVSKVVVVEPSARPDADVDYTFVQIAVDAPIADYGSMCGNMSASIGPFAVDEGWIAAVDGEAAVRVFNTNTRKLYVARFAVKDGRAVEEGDFEIPGVAGAGAKITLDYAEPGGATTGALLPSGRAVDRIEGEGFAPIEASLVDASNPVIFIRAADVGATAAEAPTAIDADRPLMARLEAIRRAGAVAMGLAETPASAVRSNPKIAMLAGPSAFTALDGRVYGPETNDLSVRIISMENCHRAITLTGAMCVATAARIPGALPNALARASETTIIANPSGLLPVEADVRLENGAPRAVSATTYRTQRRLMEGAVLAPTSLL